ncbi:MAG TPA: hypothetical protein VF691_23270 [Cytophagaceae bacterium]
MLDLNILNEDYKCLKQNAYLNFSNGRYKDSLEYIILASRMAYEFNFVSSYGDNELDDQLEKISEINIKKDINYRSEKSRIVFYDYFAWPYRGLTQQYFYTLIELDYEILLIVPNDLSFNYNNEIFKVAKENENVTLYVLDSNLDHIDKARLILQKICDYKPSKAFLHLSPWDVVASLVFNKLGHVLYRFFINLTDHAYWLGNNLIDRCIEFRNYGFQLSKELRNISKDKLTLLPYYPIINTDSIKENSLIQKFHNKVLGVSGGSGYKFVGDDNKFYHLIVDLLKVNDNFIFFLIGTGVFSSFFKDKIKSDGLEERFILIDDMENVYSFLTSCDIYIGSFPFCGALMSQIAASANLPIVAYNRETYAYNIVSEFFPYCDEKFKIVSTDEDFHSLSHKLINDVNFRKVYASYTHNKEITKQEFKETLQDILNGTTTKFNYLLKHLPYVEQTHSNMSRIAIEIENNYQPKYYYLYDLISDLSKLTDNSFHLKDRLRQYRKSLSIPELNSFQKLVGRVKNAFRRRVQKQIDRFKSTEVITRNGVLLSFKKFDINNPQYLSIGNRLINEDKLKINILDKLDGQKFLPEVTIGENVWFKGRVEISCIEKVDIGNSTTFADNVKIADHLINDQGSLFAKPVIIKNNVSIGFNVRILPGVTIGENVKVGSNTLVDISIPDDCLACGEPMTITKPNV